jgi:sialic acid synthase SpsE
MSIPAYKTASGDLTYLQLLEYMGTKNKPIILSTGMSTVGEIEKALNTIYRTGNHQVAILHCVSNYPTLYEDTNLKAINTLKNIFGIPVGFSDHTKGTLIPAMAVALGSNIIEKHFTIDKNLQGPDHELSLEPHEFKEMVENIRNVEKALGDGIKHPTESKNMILAARRSIFTNQKINEDTILEEKMFKIVRPSAGISPEHLSSIIGKRSVKTIEDENPVNWGDIE